MKIRFRRVLPFLLLALILFGVLALGTRDRAKQVEVVEVVEVAQVEWTSPLLPAQALSFDDLYILADRFGSVRDGLPGPMLTTTEDDLYAWAIEILPYFDLEGISPVVTVPNKLSFFFDPFNGNRHTHVLGVSDCMTYAQLNIRYANPASAWFGRSDGVFTLTHELAHVQQGFATCQGDRHDLVETSAQLMALEVLSSMANSGNYTAYYSVVDEMYSMLMASLQYRVETESQAVQFESLRLKYTYSPVAQAQYDKSMRDWAGDEEGLLRILRLYNYNVIEIIAYSPPVITYLATPQDEDGIYASLVLDDLYYLIAHVDEMREGYYAALSSD